MEINNKYGIGDRLYTVVRKPIRYDCPVCEGTGVFQHNGYDVKCPHCCGSGKLHDKKTLWSVADEQVVIRRIIASVCGARVTCRYGVSYSGNDCNVRNRGEENLFFERTDAEEWCRKNNSPIEERS